MERTKNNFRHFDGRRQPRFEQEATEGTEGAEDLCRSVSLFSAFPLRYLRFLLFELFVSHVGAVQSWNLFLGAFNASALFQPPIPRFRKESARHRFDVAVSQEQDRGRRSRDRRGAFLVLHLNGGFSNVTFQSTLAPAV